MFKLFLADLRQMKKPFLFLVLSIPLLHYLDSTLFYYALPTTVDVKWSNAITTMTEPFASVSGWPFAIMVSIILLLFSEDTGSSSQGRLASLAILPLSRWQIGLSRHLPTLTVVPALGLLLNVYRLILAFFYAMSKNDLWVQHHSVDWNTTVASFWWAVDKVTNIFGNGYASILFQLIGWASLSLLFLSIPLLIDDLWPNIKKSSFSLWLSSSLFVGITLQAVTLALARHFGLELLPHVNLPPEFEAGLHPWMPSLMTIQLTLAIGIMALELWRFQRRSSYV